MITQTDLDLADGRRLRVYDTGSDGGRRDLVVFWMHGTPHIGEPPEPLMPAADQLGIRWVSYDRPGYGGSTRLPGRIAAAAAADVASIADSLGIDRFALMGHSGGGPHALACGALLPDRVIAVISAAGFAPFDGDGLDWLAGMAPSCQVEHRAAVSGRAALEDYLASADLDPEAYTEDDLVAMSGLPWSWLTGIAGRGLATEEGGWLDDVLVYVSDWGYDPASATAPVLLLHGGQDRMIPRSHSEWLARRCAAAELRLYAGDGHVSVLSHAGAALDWLRQVANELAAQ